MQVKVNGEDREVPSSISISTLLAQANLAPERVAIELNRRLIRAEKYSTLLNEGDEIEIVTFVGGG